MLPNEWEGDEALRGVQFPEDTLGDRPSAAGRPKCAMASGGGGPKKRRCGRS